MKSIEIPMNSIEIPMDSNAFNEIPLKLQGVSVNSNEFQWIQLNYNENAMDFKAIPMVSYTRYIL